VGVPESGVRGRGGNRGGQRGGENGNRTLHDLSPVGDVVDGHGSKSGAKCGIPRITVVNGSLPKGRV
jgi:hypothetical protein